MDFLSYIRLFKFRYHISFVCVIFGAMILAHQPFYTLIKPLLLIYLSFNVLMYGGLYTLNDIVDVESDSKHPKKKNRPLPSKKISIKSAYIFALVILFSGLAIAYFYFGTEFFMLYLAFVVVNQFYTRFAKKIPYLEIVANSLTYPMRILLGAMVVTTKIPYLFLVMILFFAFGIACLRRAVEMKSPGWEARKVLKYYTQNKLFLLEIMALFLIILIFSIDFQFLIGWYIFAILLYSVSIFGGYFSRHFTGFYQWMFLN